MRRKHGWIVRIVRDRGFGFIRDDEGNEFFFHATGLFGVDFDELNERAEVVFVLQPDPRIGKPRAVEVEIVEDSGSVTTVPTSVTQSRKEPHGGHNATMRPYSSPSYARRTFGDYD